MSFQRQKLVGSTHPSPLQQVTIRHGLSWRTQGFSNPRASLTALPSRMVSMHPLIPDHILNATFAKVQISCPAPMSWQQIAPILRAAAIGQGGGAAPPRVDNSVPPAVNIAGFGPGLEPVRPPPYSPSPYWYPPIGTMPTNHGDGRDNRPPLPPAAD